MKLLLDELFGRECFLNEIIWAYDYGAPHAPPLAGQARHDPRLRARPASATTSTPRRSTASRTWRRARHAGEGGARQAADRRLVAHDRADRRAREDRLPDAEARGRSCAAWCSPRRGRATGASTRSRARARSAPWRARLGPALRADRRERRGGAGGDRAARGARGRRSIVGHRARLTGGGSGARIATRADPGGRSRPRPASLQAPWPAVPRAGSNNTRCWVGAQTRAARPRARPGGAPEADDDDPKETRTTARSCGSSRSSASCERARRTRGRPRRCGRPGLEIALAVREVGAMLVNIGWEQTFPQPSASADEADADPA